MAGQAVVCSTILADPGVPGAKNPLVDIYHEIRGFRADEKQWIVAPNVSQQKVSIAIERHSPQEEVGNDSIVERGMLQNRGDFLALVAEDHPPQARVAGLVLLHGFSSVEKVSPEAISILASRKFDDSTAYVIRVRDGNVFKATVTIPNDPDTYTFMFRCEDGAIVPHEPKRDGKGPNGGDSRYGDTGGSTPVPRIPPEPPRSLFAKAPFPPSE